ncbi:MAG: GIY-YIG nuclease family protein [Candidatus Pacearchaeota archaeon]
MILYIIYNKKTQLTKIGITENLEKRIAHLENQCGCSLDCVAWIDIVHARETEIFLHATFDCYRQRGEWFSLDKDGITFLSHFWYEYFYKNRYIRVFDMRHPVEIYEKGEIVVEEFLETHFDVYENKTI